MSSNKKLTDLEEQIRQCVKCGICQAHCPAYRHNRKEGDVARGKIALAAALLDGEVELEQRLEEDISMCLMCGSCVNKCPNKVATPEIVGAIRREVTANRGLSFFGKSLATVINSPPLMKTLTRGGALFSPLLLKKVPQSSGLRLRFPAPLMKNRTIPKLPLRNLFDMVPQFTKGDGKKPTIGFFAGCSITHVFPAIGKTMVDLLVNMGYSVHVPRSQGCCGIPALSAGAGETVEKLAEKNIGAFGKYREEHIITACASCNGGIGEYYQTMHGNDQSFTEKVVDFTVFLQQNGLIERLTAQKKWAKRVRVTYHDPCHMKTQGIIAEPRALLQALPNVEFVEMENSALCCGLGGTFSVYHYECSKAIGAKKIPGLQKSGADMIATACPGCMIQLQDVINHAGLEIKAVHLLELIEQALAAE